MKNNLEIASTNLKELSVGETIEITGGDKFLKDVGYAVGYAAGWLWDQTEGMRMFGGSAAFWS